MMRNGTIILVEDDADDTLFFTDAVALTGIKNEIKCFKNTATALHYLNTSLSPVFLIVSDINMKPFTGFEFKKQINENAPLCERQIPFIFMTTSNAPYIVRNAYSLGIQGYFEKPGDITELNDQIYQIITYWKAALVPELQT